MLPKKDDKFKSYLNLGIIRLEKLTKDKYLPYLERHLNNETSLLKFLPFSTSTIDLSNILKPNLDGNMTGLDYYSNKVGGIYLIVPKLSNSFYIGSAINFRSRFIQHVRYSSKKQSEDNKFYTFVNGDWTQFFWTPLNIVPNLALEFIKRYPDYKLNLNDLYILRSFTQFELLFLEQSYINMFKPDLNTHTLVNFPFSNWTSAYSSNIIGSIEVLVLDENNIPIGEYTSKYQAANALGFSSTTLRRYINTSILLFSPILDQKVKLIETKNPLSTKKVVFNSNITIPTIRSLDLNNIESGKLVAYSKDKQNIFGTYNSPNEASLILDGKKDSKYISRYINKERTVMVGPNKTQVYFVMNPSYLNNLALRRKPRKATNTRSILLKDTILGTSLKFSTIKEMLAYLNIKSTGATGFVKRYMNPTKLYKNRYEFHYINS
uniref:GIY-YIG domain-containing protein n=1 Tax=Cantharellus lutescens TaxID=104198 RepID=A0A2S0S4F8_9AGAM|nr:hypothetical protein [Cantharellus lutescens]AWA82226.1 hypothetical protein [Cantharellus lutescens]